MPGSNLPIFSNKNTWSVQTLPGQLNTLRTRVYKDEAPTAFCSINVQERAYTGLNCNVVRGIIGLLQGTLAEFGVVHIADHGAAKAYAAEHHNEDGSVHIFHCLGNGHIEACITTNAGVSSAEITPQIAQDCDFAPLYACLIMLLKDSANIPGIDALTSATLSAKFEEIEAVYQQHHDLNDLLQIEMSIRWISDLMYEIFRTGIIRANFCAGSVTKISANSLKQHRYAGDVVCGKCPILNGETVQAVTRKSITAIEAKELFADYAKTRHWSPAEEKFIPQFPDNYPVLPETVEIAKAIIDTKDLKVPFKNFLWQGVTGYGKSTGVEMLAYILHTPLLRLTCYTNMEAQDFLSQFVPDNSSAAAIKGLPSFLEISADPEGAYERMTGKSKPGVSCEEVQRVAYSVAQSAEKGSKFKLVESNYVKALRRGYICEVQEISRIKEAGTMVTINELDKAGHVIPLANGDYAKRHPDAIVIYTDNIGYRSCRPVDPSVMRRMDVVKTNAELTPDVVMSRVKYNTGIQNDKLLKQMMNVWFAAIKYCKENEISDGEISINDLERWVIMNAINGMPMLRRDFKETVIAKVSPDMATRDEVMDAMDVELSKIG